MMAFSLIKSRVFLQTALPAVCAVSLLCTSFGAHAEEKAPRRPGFKAEQEGVIAPGQEAAYPDLTWCDTLKDPSIYKGKHKILKFIYPGKEGWLFRSADFRTDFTLPEKTFSALKEINERLKRKGIDLVIALQPSRAMVMAQYLDPADIPEGYNPSEAKKNYKALIRKLNADGIAAADLSDVPDDVIYFFKGDPHWRREGAQWSAEKVAGMIRKNPVYKDIEKEDFSNEITWWLESEKGEFDEFVEQACDVVMPQERRPMWATTSLTAKVDENALFGDVEYPDIVVVGTSNTAHEEDFNFVGSLKQTLNADIRNRALSAGEMTGAPLVFYATDEFHDHPPKIMIWEFLSHHNFNDDIGFRQILPAIDGVCGEDEALATAEMMMTPPPGTVVSTEGSVAAPAVLPGQKVPMYDYVVFDDLDAGKIPGKGSYLYLDVTKPEIRKLRVGVLYANGDAEEVKITRSLRVDNNGKYYLQFNPDIDQDLMLVQIETDRPEGQIKASICKDDNI